jgi:hypothetical protein
VLAFSIFISILESLHVVAWRSLESGTIEVLHVFFRLRVLGEDAGRNNTNCDEDNLSKMQV